MGITTALREETLIDKIELLPESGIIQVRRVTRVIRGEPQTITLPDGTDTTINDVIGYQYHRHALMKHADLTDEDALVVTIAHAFWGA